MRKEIIPLVATAAAQLLVIGSIAAAFAFQPKETQLPIAMIPVQADIEQGECIRRDPAPYEPITYHVPLDADLQQYTAEMCDLYEVPLELAYAVMQVESGYTVSATSSTGDYGLMQINSINSEWLSEKIGVTDLTDPYQNIRSGVFILSDLYGKYGDWHKALICYNYGEGGAREHVFSKGYTTTSYSRTVMEYADAWAEVLA